MFDTSFAKGRLWHKRYTPKIHEFAYNLNSWMIDLDNIEAISQLGVFVTSKWLNLYHLNPNRYFRGYSGSIKTKALNKLSELGVKSDAIDKIFLLGQLSNLGLYFSPLNLYICICNNQPRYVMAEVSNTPWNERHYYLIDLANPPYNIAKKFHVSPFWNINQNYHWQFDFKNDYVFIQIDSFENETKVFSAGYSAHLLGISKKNQIIKEILKQPLNAFKIIYAIYYQALKIFLKKIPFVPYRKI